jgi:hypothetical protein
MRITSSETHDHTQRPNVFRIKKSQTWFPRFQWQYLYLPLLAFPLLAHKMRYEDYNNVKNHRRGLDVF